MKTKNMNVAPHVRLPFLLLICSSVWFLGTLEVWSASVTQEIKMDYFGYRPGDRKVAIFTDDPRPTVEIRDTSDVTVFTIPEDGGSMVDKGFDGDPSGDSVWWVDFSSFTTPGTYRLFVPAWRSQSYDFEVREDVYNAVVLTALKTFYYQRCHTAKEAAYAGPWSDSAPCHMDDASLTNAMGEPDYGVKDLTGGWHDAGDYNKYVWKDLSTAILFMLRAYEDNPGIFEDGELNIPESGNGIPDILDEIKWELDWLLKMQLPDGSVLGRVYDDHLGSDSPPSADTTPRYYYGPDRGSGGVFAGIMAISSRIFEAEGMSTYAATLKAAALDTWNWLLTQGDDETKVWAAAEIFRLDDTVTSARDYVDNYYPSDWSGIFFNVMHYDTHAAITYVQSPGATAKVVSEMKKNIREQVDSIFSNNDLYRNGMPSWSYYWGSNAIRAGYGLFLLKAANLGETGSYTAQECVDHAQDFLHFFHGQNTMRMTYLTNMSPWGGDHVSYQMYHAWFGDSHSVFCRDNFIGKPVTITEPDYPYFKGTDNYGITDNNTSSLGPAPGYVPGGPNMNYGIDEDGNDYGAIPPKDATYYNRFYRDWCDQTVSDARTWEITENSIKYQGAYVALGAYFMGIAEQMELGYDDGTCDEIYPEVHVKQYLRQRFLVSDFGLSGDYLVKTVRIYWGPTHEDFAGVIKLREYDTGDVVTAASFTSPVPYTWQEYDVSGLEFVSDHFYVELWQTSEYGYICGDTDEPHHSMSEVSTNSGETWHLFTYLEAGSHEIDFMIRVIVTPVTPDDSATDTSPPTISSTTPANGATDMAVNTSITASFSEEMDSLTITTATFLVRGSGNIAGTVTYSDTTATFAPATNLDYNTTYTATITTGAKDLFGNALEADHTWSFTTQSEAEEEEEEEGLLAPCFISVLNGN